MSDVPEKVAKEVLSTLPAEEILNFRGISKSAIESPEFIYLQLAHSMETHSNHSLILSSEAECLHLYSADYDSVITTNSAFFQELEYPLMAEHPSSFLGSCNGLICLLYPQDVIVLWNPSTNRFKKLPAIIPRKALYAFYGFGYDSVNEDYKVVRILQVSHFVNDNQIEVYSMNSNSWRWLPLDSPYFVKSGNAVLANGALHWVVKENSASERDTGKSVIAFDLGTEKFSPVTLPVFSDSMFYLNLGVLDGCLSVVCNYEMDEHAEIWVREKNPGVDFGWTKLISIRQSDLNPGVDFDWTKLISIRQSDLADPDGFAVLRPIAFSKCGKRVLLEQDERKLLWYDLEEKSTSYAVVQTSSGVEIPSFELDICVRSLVQPYSLAKSKQEAKK